MAALTESDTQMLREMARGLNGPGVEDFITRVHVGLMRSRRVGSWSRKTMFAPPALLNWRHNGNDGARGLCLTARRRCQRCSKPPLAGAGGGRMYAAAGPED